MKKFYALIMALAGFSASNLFAQTTPTLTAGANPTSVTLPTCSTTLTGVFTSNGNTLKSYAWTESSSDAVPATIASASAVSTSVGFTVAGSYSFTLTATYTNSSNSTKTITAKVSVTVNSGSTSTYPNNLFATSSLGSSFSGFAIGSTAAQSGMVINGMNNIASVTGASSSAALGEDINGYFYYLPNVTNTGSVTVYAMNHDGSGQTAVATAKINGSANTSLGFVRLGIDPSGYGWILASDNSSTLYLANFKANGLNPTTINIINSNVGVSGGGTPGTFSSGDLAFDKNGVMFALANDASGNTYIYTMTPSLNNLYLTRKWTLVSPSGSNFTGTVDGCAFDSAGSIYISSTQGLYFIDQNTVNNSGTGTVQTRLAYNGTGFTDLATNIFPPTSTLPITLILFTASKQGSDALLKWSTETELNSNYTDVERSTDGVNYTKEGSVPASGTTSSVHNYQFSDPINGLSGIVYYRLKEVDIDGNSKYSNIIPLRLDGASLSSDFSAYPNPFNSGIKIIATSTVTENGTIEIRNINGQRIINQPVSLLQGQNVLLVNSLSALQPGVYLIRLSTSEGSVTQKIIKQ